MKKIILPFAIAACALAAQFAPAAPPPDVKEIMSKPLTGIPGKEGLVLTVTYPPGGADEIHRHDAHAFIYVLKGSIVMQLRGAEPVTLKPGEGLAQALASAQVVVDVANAPSWEDNAVLAFFETSGRNLLAAEAAAGVGHHVALSVVGTDRLLESGYFRAKMAQEKLIKASPVPYTIVRATQFFEFVGGIAQSATDGQTIRLPPVLIQPIVSDDVAAALVQ